MTRSYGAVTNRSHILKGNVHPRIRIMSNRGDLFTTQENPQVVKFLSEVNPRAYDYTSIFLHVANKCTWKMLISRLIRSIRRIFCKGEYTSNRTVIINAQDESELASQLPFFKLN